jgi:hypothetical protein
VRWAIVLAFLATASVSGYYIYRYEPWQTWIPTRVILAFQGADCDWAAGILSERFHYATMSAAEANRMFEQAFVSEPELGLVSPYPAGLAQYADLHCRLDLGGPKIWSWVVFVEEATVHIDGVVVLESNESRVVGYAPFMESVEFEVPPMTPGTHGISITAVVGVRGPNFSDDPPGPAWHRWTVTATGEVIVQDRPVRDFVTLRSSEELRARVEAQLEIPSEPEDRHLDPYEIPFRFEDLPIDVVGEVWARPSGETDFTRVQPFYAYRVWPGYLGERTEGSGVIRLKRLPGVAQAERVDIRIVADSDEAARLALKLHVREYYAGVIERFGVLVPRGTDEPLSEE